MITLKIGLKHLKLLHAKRTAVRNNNNIQVSAHKKLTDEKIS